MRKKKKYPFWFEDPYEMIREMWERPFRFPRIRFAMGTFPVDIIDAKNKLILRADLPGFKKDEIKLKVTPTTVDISAEKRKESIEKDENYFRQERSFGSARRVMTLPEEVKSEKARAKFEHGVLEITLPKKTIKKKEKEVEIK
ncbi:MAG: Hsp20/alpha crystallin family protein [Candidatus Aenigmatarchaeota archaeon]